MQLRSTSKHPRAQPTHPHTHTSHIPRSLTLKAAEFSVKLHRDEASALTVLASKPSAWIQRLEVVAL